MRRYIQERQAAFAECAFFEELSVEEASPEALSFMSGLTFFVMAFQDILRLNEAKVRDPALRAIARMHREEDRGHDAWFLRDILQVEGRVPDVREVFGAGHAVTRDAAYALVVEALQATDDCVSIALLLVLESTGNVFFGRVVEWLERAGSPTDCTTSRGATSTSRSATSSSRRTRGGSSTPSSSPTTSAAR